MPPKAASTSTSLSDREMELLRNYHRCIESKPQVNMTKFADISGFGNVQSATSNMNRLLRKLAGDQETSGSASPAKDPGDESAATATPASKKKSGGRKRKSDAAASNDAEDESPTKKKASPTKRKGKTTANAASQEEEDPVKEEASESADDDA